MVIDMNEHLNSQILPVLGELHIGGRIMVWELLMECCYMDFFLQIDLPAHLYGP